MPIQKKEYEPDLETDRAKNVKGDTIYIDEAESGEKGYFCLGCDKIMRANIQKKNPTYRSYFSHAPVDVSKGDKKCTYSNREHREIIASDILQRLKSIKVPAVLKFPPKGNKGNPVELTKSRFITAYKVRSELTFYEDEEGEIYHGKNPDIEDRYLLLRPDVTFFNEKDEPILFIELVVTHKVTDEKKIKLRRLGIDTVSVIVPRGSDQEIEENFKSVQRVKWEYNDQEARTNYISVSNRATERVLDFDEQQRRIFGESFKCRLSRVNNTIRSLRKCLEGELYHNAEQNFEREIFRVKSATETARSKLGNLEEKHRAKVFSKFKVQNLETEQREQELGAKQEEFRIYQNDLEERYLGKAGEIGVEQEKVREDLETEFRNSGTEEEFRSGFNKLREELRREFDEISEDWRRTIGEREEINQDISRRKNELTELFRRLEEEERDSFESRKHEVESDIRQEFTRKEEELSGEFKTAAVKEEGDIQQIRNQEGALRAKFEDLERKELEDFRTEEGRIKQEEADLETTIREEIIRELNDPSSTLPRELKSILEAEGVGDDYKIAQRQESSYKRAREFLKKGTWKTR